MFVIVTEYNSVTPRLTKRDNLEAARVSAKCDMASGQRATIYELTEIGTFLELESYGDKPVNLFASCLND